MTISRFFVLYGKQKNKRYEKKTKQRKNDAELIKSAICGYVLGKVSTSALAGMLRENGLRMVRRDRAKTVIISDNEPNKVTEYDLLIAKSRGYKIWFLCDKINVVVSIRGIIEEAAKIMQDYNLGAIDFLEKIDRLSRFAVCENEVELLISKYFNK